MEDLEFDKNLKKAITAEERKRQKVYLQSIEDTIEAPKPKRTNWWVAASIVIVVGFSVYFALFNQSLSNEALYSKYFYPYENVVVPIVRDRVNQTNKAKAFSFYEQGEYQKAIDGFIQLTTNDSIDVATITFYKANTYLQLKQFEKAKTLFSQVVENKEWEAESLWYLALTSIKLTDTEAALKYLQKLKNKKTFKYEEVKELIDLLN
jgi:tetratricopeptide (TPR) repeat protein